jgi:hypothetical protein
MIRYHQSLPQNAKDFYSEYDTVDFQLTFENRNLVNSSIRIEADVDVYSAGTTKIAVTDKIYIDNQIGGHGFFSGITTELQSSSVIENITEYPRYVKMQSEASNSPEDVFNSDKTCELRTPGRKITNSMLMGIVDDAGKITPANSRTIDFSIKPLFCLNQMSSDLPYSKSGAVNISLKLNRNFSALFGSDVGVDSGYYLYNVKISFMSVETTNTTLPIQLKTLLSIKQNISSALANISTKIPAVCNAVSCSFQRQSRENTMSYNNHETERLPSVKQLQFLFNDSQQEYITYQIDDQEELLDRYLQSFSSDGNNSISLNKLRSNKGWGIGLNFGDFIDLSKQKFNVQITSEVQSTDKYIMYMYFHSLLNL